MKNKYNIYRRVTGEFMAISYGVDAYDAIVAYGKTIGLESEEAFNRFYAEIILF